MKYRYWVFVADAYYPRGGIHDLVGWSDDEQDAIAIMRNRMGGWGSWGHVYDAHTMTIVAERTKDEALALEAAQL